MIKTLKRYFKHKRKYKVIKTWKNKKRASLAFMVTVRTVDRLIKKG